MPEYNMVSDIEEAIQAGLYTLFEGLDIVASKWGADYSEVAYQLQLSVRDLDIEFEYANWSMDRREEYT